MADEIVLKFTKPPRRNVMEATCSKPLFTGAQSTLLGTLRQLEGVSGASFDGEVLEIELESLKGVKGLASARLKGETLEIEVTQSYLQCRRVATRVANALSVEGGPKYLADVDALPAPAAGSPQARNRSSS